MNAKQRRIRRRAYAKPIVLLIDGLDEAADMMRRTGQTMTPDECSSLADGLREMLQSNPEWRAIAQRRARPNTLVNGE